MASGTRSFLDEAKRGDAEVAEGDAEGVGKRFFTSKKDKFLRTRTKDVLDLPQRREGRKGTRSFFGVKRNAELRRSRRKTRRELGRVFSLPSGQGRQVFDN
jgi:hypothetical protein